MNTKIFGRDPALFGAVLASALTLLSLFLHLSTEWQGSANAVILAAIGFYVAVRAKADGSAALFVGLAKAVLALGLAWGLKLDPAVQAEIMALVTTLASFYVRTQITAPVGPTGERV